MMALDRQVALFGRGRTDPLGAIGQAHVQGAPIGVRVHRDRLDAQLAARADDADGNLAAIGDQDAAEHGGGREDVGFVFGFVFVFVFGFVFVVRDRALCRVPCAVGRVMVSPRSTPACASRETRACLPAPRPTRAGVAMASAVSMPASSGPRRDTSGMSAFAAAIAPGAAVRIHRRNGRPSRRARLLDDRVHQADLPRASRREPGAGQKQLARSRTSDLRQHERRDHRRDDAQLHFGEPEHRVIRSDDDVADRAETRTAAERGAVHASRSPAAAVDRAPETCGRRRSRPACSRRSSKRTIRAIHRKSAPAQNTGPAPESTTTRTARILGDRIGPPRQLADHLLVERVADVRTVRARRARRRPSRRTLMHLNAIAASVTSGRRRTAAAAPERSTPPTARGPAPRVSPSGSRIPSSQRRAVE